MQFKPKSKKKEVMKNERSIQDLIPIKAIENDLLITLDNKVVMHLKVSPVNLELISNFALEQLFGKFEQVLTGLNYHFQTLNISMPVDLSRYIQEQREILNKTTNKFKRKLLEGYIKYAEDIEKRENIMQRQRIIAFYEVMKEDTPEERYKALLELEEKRNELMSGISELELEVKQATEKEIIHEFHTIFDYKTAQNRPIDNSNIPQIIIRGEK